MAESLDPGLYSPLTLAYLGDSVFDLYIKSHFVKASNKQVEKYHKEVIKVVNARHQARFMDTYMDLFTEEEVAIFKRGRNASVHTKAKNASMAQYKKATGFEALVGYLYLKGDKERLQWLIDLMLNMPDAEE
ncbi:MAG: hypothetical protein IIY49_00755 [Eubacterium sp.]|nr:hypothetical protein [Eubacterium sp.]